MKSVIVGTAGHIDHGKTALVKALTGIDADRLEEEKRRGITIDIGFAHLELTASNGEKLRLGFVDVPGHERFVRNMLAGIGGIDLVLLVIAADESIKPQTREHFDICRLLSVRRGITVLTKSDMVDRDTLDVARLEVEEFLRGSFLDPERTPIVAVSSKNGQGIEDLKHALIHVAAEVPAKDSSALARLPVDRVFAMKGFGTVVTGTLVAGGIRKEEELEVLPGERRVRVRGIQVHGQPADQAVAGERTALNLAGLTVEDLNRGVVLVPPNLFEATSRLDAQLSLLRSAKPLRHRARVHLHAYTDEAIAEVVLHTGARQLEPGEDAFVHLRLEKPMMLLPGDRFIVRQFSPVVTIGGGCVLDAHPLRKQKKAVLPRFLTTLANATPAEILLARVERRSTSGLSIGHAISETGWSPNILEKLLTGLSKSKKMIRAGDLLILPEALQALNQDALVAILDFHKSNPLVPGIGKEELRSRIDASPDVLELALNSLLSEKKIEINGELVQQAGRGVVLKDEEAESKKTIEQAFRNAGLKVPFLNDVLAGVRVDRARAQKIVTLLLREKALIKLSDELVFHQMVLLDLRQKIAAYKAKSPKIDVAAFKDLTGVSRKYAIPLLEYLDRERITRRVGDVRVIL